MPRNGSGTYTLPSGINPVVTQTLITSNWANTTMNDLATALTNSLAKDGQTIPVANLPMGGFRHTGVGDPTAADQYTTLSYVQKGSSNRLINVSGSNQITGNLPGGLVTFTPGQIVQLTPAVNNNIGGVSLAINGGLSAQVTMPNGNFNIPAGGLAAGKPYLLMWTGTVWRVIVGIDETSFMQSAISGWDRPANGIYPDITLVNPNTVSVPGGTGRIVQPSTRDVSGVTEVSWATQNVVIANVATQWETTLAVNSQGQIVQFVGNVQSAWARNNIILGVIGHINGTIVSITNKPAIYGDAAYLAYDLGVLFRNRLISGGTMAANSGNPLHLNIKGGQLWNVGLNADQKDSPNIFTFPDQIDITFFPVTAQNTVGAATQTVPVANYDPAAAGVVTPIPGPVTTSVIHRFYLLAGQFVFVYGQTAYADLDTAVANIALDDTNYVKPSKLTDATFIGYIIARKDATNLGITTQARLISAGQGGSGSGSGGGGGIPDAPLDGSTYARNNGAWVKAVDQVQAGTNISVDNTNPNKPIVNVPSANLVAGRGTTFSDSTPLNRLLGAGNLTITGTESFRNKIINGSFFFWQRGTGLNMPPSPSARICDRFFEVIGTGTSSSVTQQAHVVGQTDIPDGPTFFHRTGVIAAGDAAAGVSLTDHRIENIWLYASAPFVLSFWAKADANRSMSIEFIQNFGAGGSPEVQGIGVQKINLTTSWQKFSIPVTLPSIAGKTITFASSYLRINFWYSAGTNFNARTNSLGNQVGTFDLSQVQFEPGSVATNFEVRPAGLELALCQRYYYRTGAAPFAIGDYFGAHPGTIPQNNLITVNYGLRWPVTMRGTPTITTFNPNDGSTNTGRVSGTGNVPYTSMIVSESSLFQITLQSAMAVGNYDFIMQVAADAEL